MSPLLATRLEVRSSCSWQYRQILRAVFVFSAAGDSFDRSSELRARLVAANQQIAMPVFFMHVETDYSLSSGKVLDARRELTGKTIV
jgi:hypothetical protein